MGRAGRGRNSRLLMNVGTWKGSMSGAKQCSYGKKLEIGGQNQGDV